MSASRRARNVYLRRRFSVALCGAALLACAWAAAARADAPRPAGPTVVVQAGDSLWRLGEEYAPRGTDLRPWMAEVRRINHLQGADLAAGQLLRLPA